MTGVEARLKLSHLLSTNQYRAGALFISWLPCSGGEPDPSGEAFLDIEDPDRNEVWNIEKCTLDESIGIVREQLHVPVRECIKKADFSVAQISDFVLGLDQLNSIELDYVCEAYLKFRFSLKDGASEIDLFSKIATYNRTYFRVDDTRGQERWAWRIFKKERTFSIGAA